MKELTGKKQGKLTVISLSTRKSKGGHTFFNCLCECGKETEVRKDRLLSGHTSSCGCSRLSSAKDKKNRFVVSNRPGDTARVSAEKIQEGVVRRRIEDIKEKFALERELYSI